MPILKNIALLATPRTGARQGDLLQIKGAAIVWERDKITWIGPERELPTGLNMAEVFDAHGALLIPGLIDCHTHLAFGGWRAEEFAQRNAGRTYLEIAQQGGGIMSTVRATRDASFDTLLSLCCARIQAMSHLGVTTIEAKSGYGLSVADEIKILEVYAAARSRTALTVVSTFLGAHTIPGEYHNNRAGYLELVIEQMIPEVARRGLASFCDCFVEMGAYSVEEARTILTAARTFGLELKLHVDQLSDGMGGKLAADLKAISADHLEHVSDTSIAAMARADVVGVILPIATLYTHEQPLDARRLIAKGVSVAVATDFNPGTAPSYHLPFAMLLACSMNRMSPLEVLDGATRMAARALKLGGVRGTLEVGKQADFALIDAPSIEQWLYHFVPNACLATIKDGSLVYGRI